MKPRLFIGSSTEALKIANAVHANLEFSTEVTVWTQEVFKLSVNTIDSLAATLKDMDFGVFVFSPDDITNLRGESHKTVRDNVLFELGLFVGKLGKERSFFLMPRGEENFHLPTDLLGITPGYYEANRTDNNWQAATGVACNQISNIVAEKGRKIKGTDKTQIAQQQPEEESESQIIQEEKLQSIEQDFTTIDIFVALDKNEFDKAFSIIETKKEASSNEAGKLYFESLKGLVKSKIDLEDGVSFIKNLIAENRKNADLYITASYIYELNHLFDEALKVLEQGLEYVETDHNKTLLNYNKALILIKSEQEDTALKILTDLIEKNTENSNVYLKATEILEEQGEFEEVEKVYKQAIKHFPKNEAILLGYGKYLSKKGSNPGFLNIFQKLTSLFPKNSVHWGYLGNAYLNLELYGLALEAYTRANELSEHTESWIIGNIGNIYNNRGFYPEAIKFLRESINLDADSEYSHNRLSSALKNNNEEIKKANTIIRKYKQEQSLQSINTEKL